MSGILLYWMPEHLKSAKCKFRHPQVPASVTGKAEHTENWLRIYRETRPRSPGEKIVDFLKALGLLKKPEVQEVYIMEEGTKTSK